jgi:hypothetical protein
MTQVSPKLAQGALKLVFGADSSLTSTDLIDRIDPLTLRAAFRNRAMQVHPDRADSLGVDASRLEEAFKRLHGAYRLLTRIVEKDITIETPDRPAPSNRRSAGHTAHGKSYAPADKGYYRGPMPSRPLRFAQYLYYAGLIDWQTMIDAITWQMHVRPKIGEIGRAYRFFDHGEIIEIIREREAGELFGNVALRLGKVSRFQLLAMVGKQKNLNLPIGKYFLEEELFNRPEIESLLLRNQHHNRLMYGR